MDKLQTGIVVTGSLAIVSLVLAVEAWLRGPDALPHRLWRLYASWQKELSAYLLDRLTIKQFATRHALWVVAALCLSILVMLKVGPLPLLAFGLMGAGLIIPILTYQQQVVERREKLQQQIDPTLQLIANALQVAPNLEEALRLGTEHLQAPMSEELNLVTTSYRLGKTLDEALQEMAQRCNDPFISAMVIALVVGRRTGGNIAATLRRIAFSTREAVRVELELAAKTRGQRNQFYLIVALYPLGLVGMRFALPSAWEILTHAFVGKVALAVSMAVVVACTLWARQILSPENL